MKQEERTRTTWLRILGYFFFIMLLLTILSRAADSIMIPTVKTARPLPGALTHTVILNGAVEANELYPVIAPDGMIVTRVHARVGQCIKAGDVLISYDIEKIQSELNSKKAELERITLEAKLRALGNVSEQNTEQMEIERRILQLDVETAQNEVDSLNSLLANGGVLVSPVDGVVNEALVQSGDITSGVAFRIATNSSGVVVRASVEESQWPYLQMGMEGNVQRRGGTQRQQATAMVSELIASPPGYEAIFELPDNTYGIGQNLMITLTQVTETYEMRVPLSSVVESNGIKGVYRIRTGDSVLGEMEYAEFVPARVIETDSQYAAIEATLSDKDQIIIATNKPINAEDRVRSEQ